MNVEIPNHPTIGQEFIFRPDLPPSDASKDFATGTVIAGHGHRLTVLAVFENWNGVPGLDMYYVHCHETGHNLHLSPSEITGE